MHRLPLLLITVFNYLFGLTFLWLFLSIIFNNQIYSFNGLSVFFCILGWLMVTCGFYKAISNHEMALEKREKKIAAIWIFAFFVFQLVCGYLLAMTTSWDTEAVFRGAISLNEQGHLGRHTGYFQVFPHNLGATSALHLLFSLLSAETTQDYYLIATLYNVSSITLGVVFGYLICRELYSVKIALLFLWLISCCIPLHFYTPVFYSDTLSLPFLMMSYYLYLLILKSDSLNKKIIYASLLGIACALGTLIKFTVVIVAIAILIDLIMRGKFKSGWLLAAMVAASICYAGLLGFDHYRYHSLLDKTLTEEKKIPYTHWVMMGLAGNGAYNGSDYGYTHSFPTLAERSQANLDKISERLKDYGLGGYLEFLGRKQQLNFGSGIYGVHEMIDDGPLRPNALHQIALDTGKHYEKFRHLAQGFHIFIFLLIILSAFYDAATKTPSAMDKLAIRLSITGIFIFLALWEANSRYLLNYVPLCIMGAALGFPDIYRVMGILKKNLCEHLRAVRASSAL
jgi:hypothetical protein